MASLMKCLRFVFGSDVFVATVAILTATTLTASVWFVLAWLSYRERYGVSFSDFLTITF
ncbi:MAG: hypothetical protein O2780_19035 [Proteobacteria bacterium]|nr:hypothetical protein [Pseudomonadota bacterium]